MIDAFAGRKFLSPWPIRLRSSCCSLCIPVLALLKGKSGNEGAVSFSSLHILNRLGSMSKGRAGGFQIAALFLAIGSAILALSRPQVGKPGGNRDRQRHRIDSRHRRVSLHAGGGFSYRAQPGQPAPGGQKSDPRFYQGSEVRTGLGSSPFAGRPYLASPLTLSKSWLEGPYGLGRVQIGLVEDGTAIGSAIAAAAKRLDKRTSKSKVIVSC